MYREACQTFFLHLLENLPNEIFFNCAALCNTLSYLLKHTALSLLLYTPGDELKMPDFVVTCILTEVC